MLRVNWDVLIWVLLDWRLPVKGLMMTHFVVTHFLLKNPLLVGRVARECFLKVSLSTLVCHFHCWEWVQTASYWWRVLILLLSEDFDIIGELDLLAASIVWTLGFRILKLERRRLLLLFLHLFLLLFTFQRRISSLALSAFSTWLRLISS